MFERLSGRFQAAFRRFTGRGRITEANVREAMEEIRLALLDADVNYDVVTKFVDEVREACLGQEVLQGVEPGQQAVKIVNDHLVALMGGEEAAGLDLESGSDPVVIMLCGLQGSGKTTTAAKLAFFLQRKYRKKVLLGACDVQRPAAIDQLEILGREIGLPVHADRGCKDVPRIARDAVQEARRQGRDVVILDTAGRLQIDETLVQELVDVRDCVHPDEILLVADSALGQEAVSVAEHFNDALDISGIILTKMDGDARGGAALSMRCRIRKPVKFVTVGEQVRDLQVFYPERMASRILGMGDILSLVDRAREEIEAEKAEELQRRIRDCTFGFDDFLSQMHLLRRMGGLASLLKFLPGAPADIPEEILDDDAFRKTEGVICSMTRTERRLPEIIDVERRRRIAAGCGSTVMEVNRTINQFLQTRKIMSNLTQGKKLKSMGGLFSGGMPDMGGMGGFGGMGGGGGMPRGGFGGGGNNRSKQDRAKRDARKKMARDSRRKNRGKKK